MPPAFKNSGPIRKNVERLRAPQGELAAKYTYPEELRCLHGEITIDDRLCSHFVLIGVHVLDPVTIKYAVDDAGSLLEGN